MNLFGIQTEFAEPVLPETGFVSKDKKAEYKKFFLLIFYIFRREESGFRGRLSNHFATLLKSIRNYQMETNVSYTNFHMETDKTIIAR